MVSFDQSSDGGGPQRGMSSTAKVLLIFGGIGGFLLLLCCGGLSFLGWKGFNLAQNMISEDPVVINARTQDMAQIEIPDEFEPKAALDLIVFRTVNYQSKENAILMLIEVSEMGAGNPQEQREQILRQMRQQGNAPGANTQISAAERETKEFEIDGKTIEFEFTKGNQGNQKVRQVVGVFQGKRGTVMLMLIVPESAFDEEAVVRMIKSIRAKSDGEEEPDDAGSKDGAAGNDAEKGDALGSDADPAAGRDGEATKSDSTEKP